MFPASYATPHFSIDIAFKASISACVWYSPSATYPQNAATGPFTSVRLKFPPDK